MAKVQALDIHVTARLHRGCQDYHTLTSSQPNGCRRNWLAWIVNSRATIFHRCSVRRGPGHWTHSIRRPYAWRDWSIPLQAHRKNWISGAIKSECGERWSKLSTYQSLVWYAFPWFGKWTKTWSPGFCYTRVSTTSCTKKAENSVSQPHSFHIPCLDK